MVCHECDLLVDLPNLLSGQKAFCPRCDFLLAANRSNALGIVIAFSFCGLLFLTLANAFPFLGFSASGQERTVTLLESVAILATEDLPSLAVVVFASIILIPAIVLLGVTYVASSISLNRPQPHLKIVLRWVLVLVPWSMAEIFLIGILVSFIKIASLADIALQLSFWSYVFFTISMSIVLLYLDKRYIWQRLEELNDG